MFEAGVWCYWNGGATGSIHGYCASALYEGSGISACSSIYQVAALCIFSTRNSSYGKVMFSQASVSYSLHEEWRGGMFTRAGWVDMGQPGGGYSPRHGTGGGYLPHPGHGTRGWVVPLLLTPSGNYHTYGQHACGTYPTGMLSCILLPQTQNVVWNIFLRRLLVMQKGHCPMYFSFSASILNRICCNCCSFREKSIYVMSSPTKNREIVVNLPQLGDIGSISNAPGHSSELPFTLALTRLCQVVCKLCKCRSSVVSACFILDWL